MNAAAASKLYLTSTDGTSSSGSGNNTQQDTTSNFYITSRTIKCTNRYTRTKVWGDEFVAKAANFTA